MKRAGRLILIAAILLFLFSGCSNIKKLPPIQNGVLDLTNWNVRESPIFRLDGKWEFYWDKLPTVQELKNAPDLYISVPSTWENERLKGKKLPRSGYATYRLHVKTALPQGSLLALRINCFSSAYQLFINDRPIAENGVVATTRDREKGFYKPMAVTFPIPASEFDILIHVSNFHYGRGGFWYTAYMGKPGAVSDYHDKCMICEALVLGALLLFSVSYFITFLIRRELIHSLYFSLFCLFLSISVDSVGQLLFFRLFPALPFNAFIFIWFFPSAAALLSIRYIIISSSPPG